MEILSLIILGFYFLSLACILTYSFVQLHLTLSYRKYKKNFHRLKSLSSANSDLPYVTIQLPLYNELYVTERLIDKVAAIEYPAEKLEIQVLDDSSDESFEVAKRKCREIAAKGIKIEHIKRPDRIGFKAGALQYGMERAHGEFIAIFDADFLPEPDFLLQTLPYFEDPLMAVVQTRWGHINENYSIFTKALAFHLNAHFSVEQGGRNGQEYFINFNGTAGIWRKEAIIDAGGWESDTITEDLDLSYRTQLKGWKFKFLEEVVSPAELPAVMSAIKSQQYRWNKGGAETARKHLRKLLSAEIKFGQKVHGVAHLLNSTIFICVLATAILSVPALWIQNEFPIYRSLFIMASSFLLAFFILIIFYLNSLSFRNWSKWKTFKYFVTMFPVFLCFSMGLSLHNSIAVVKGLIGQKSSFIRTPKFNITSLKDSWKKNKYLNNKVELTTIMEGILTAYFIFAIMYSLTSGNYMLLPFHIMLAIGFGSIFGASLIQIAAIRRKK